MQSFTGINDRKVLEYTADELVREGNFYSAAEYYYDALINRLTFEYKGKNTFDVAHAKAILVVSGKLKALTELYSFYHPQINVFKTAIRRTVPMVSNKIETKYYSYNMHELMMFASHIINDFKIFIRNYVH